METLLSRIDELSRAKGIDPQIVIDAVKDAILMAARKYFKTNEDLVAEIHPDEGRIQVFAVKTVTDLVANPSREATLAEARRVDPNAELGSHVRFPKETDGLGRISAQLAKQVIFQKIREAERETIYGEYSGRLGEIVPSTVKRSEGPDLIVDLGRAEARLPRREQSRLESFSPGDRLRVVIKSLEKAGRGPAVIASRAAEELVQALFEQEVPEIYDGTVRIRACAREAGERTKIAVESRDRDVDAVGACVGMKGMRVQSIIRELRGEKIDIIEYSEDPVEMVTRALSPAKISRVTILDPAEKHLEAVVEDTQLSLAIGKKGQNVRLAAKLMGWRIDIKSEEEKRQEVESAMAAMGTGTPVSVLIDHGLSEKLADKLLEADAATVERLADMTPEQLEEIPGVGPKAVEKIQLAVNAYYGQFEAPSMAPEYSEEEAAEQPPAGEEPAAAQPAAAMVMPGMPVEGEDDEGEEDFVFPDEEEDETGGPEETSSREAVTETLQRSDNIEQNASNPAAASGQPQPEEEEPAPQGAPSSDTAEQEDDNDEPVNN